MTNYTNQIRSEGYMHPDYAGSFTEVGIPVALPSCGGWVLERSIPGYTYVDATSCYPLFSCRDWSKLAGDLIENNREWISLTVVTDPFGQYETDYLRQCFRDLMIPFKEHFIIDLRVPIEEIGRKRTRQQARKALRSIQIEVTMNPATNLEEWWVLYKSLIERHNITDIRAFSKNIFSRQLKIPGAIVLWAKYNDTTVGAVFYLLQGEVVHAHLGACTPQGYKLEAFRAMDYFSIEFFRDRARWLNLGGGAGMGGNDNDGLSMYKSGWATETKTSYLCGRIYDQQRYSQIVVEKNAISTGYFPAYRTGEFS